MIPHVPLGLLRSLSRRPSSARSVYMGNAACMAEHMHTCVHGSLPALLLLCICTDTHVTITVHTDTLTQSQPASPVSVSGAEPSRIVHLLVSPGPPTPRARSSYRRGGSFLHPGPARLETPKASRRLARDGCLVGLIAWGRCCIFHCSEVEARSGPWRQGKASLRETESGLRLHFPGRKHSWAQPGCCRVLPRPCSCTRCSEGALQRQGGIRPRIHPPPPKSQPHTLPVSSAHRRDCDMPSVLGSAATCHPPEPQQVPPPDPSRPPPGSGAAQGRHSSCVAGVQGPGYAARQRGGRARARIPLAGKPRASCLRQTCLAFAFGPRAGP